MIRMWKRHPVLATSAAFLLLLAGGCIVLTLPGTTRQGINYKVRAYRLPVYVKTIDFLHRHYQYQLLVDRICSMGMSDAQCALAIFDWTHANVPPTPNGWPIVDDHVLNIIIRGHGMADQAADVFVTLAVYAGIPAFFKVVREPGPDRQLVLSFARVDGRWNVFDVERGIAFRNRRGELATVDALVGDPALVDEQTRDLHVADIPYSRFISREQLTPFVVPRPLRATLQQPWPRLRYELRRAVGWEG